MSSDHERRVSELEAQRSRRDVYATASRIANQTGLNVDELLAEAEIFAERIALSGLDAVIDEMAAEAGISPTVLRADIDRMEGEFHATDH